MRVELQPAYVLHRRSWRNTSWLLDVLTAGHGLVGLVAKGVRRQDNEKRVLLQPFRKLLISFSGRTDLMTLIGAEAAEPPCNLAGDRLFSGMYLNELLLRLLHRHDPQENIFHCYHRALQRLATDNSAETALRQFEVQLLGELGYGLQLEHIADGQHGISPEVFYYYDIERGPLEPAVPTLAPLVSGRCLLALAAGDFSDAQLLREMKQLMRHVIAHYTGGRALKSRELFGPRSHGET